jgi:hypothetical protein
MNKPTDNTNYTHIQDLAKSEAKEIQSLQSYEQFQYIGLMALCADVMPSPAVCKMFGKNLIKMGEAMVADGSPETFTEEENRAATEEFKARMEAMQAKMIGGLGGMKPISV